MNFIAQNLPDISAVPPDFVKWFIVMGAFALVVWLLVKKGGAPSGGKDEPLHLGQPLEIRKAAEYAPKEETLSELEKIKADINSRYRECMRHQEAEAKKVNARLDKISQEGGERRDAIMKALHDMELRTNKVTITQAEKIHERINPLAEKVSLHEGAIAWIKERLEALWNYIKDSNRDHAETHRRMGSRIDDAIRMAGQSGKGGK